MSTSDMDESKLSKMQRGSELRLRFTDDKEERRKKNRMNRSKRDRGGGGFGSSKRDSIMTLNAPDRGGMRNASLANVRKSFANNALGKRTSMLSTSGLPSQGSRRSIIAEGTRERGHHHHHASIAFGREPDRKVSLASGIPERRESIISQDDDNLKNYQKARSIGRRVSFIPEIGVDNHDSDECEEDEFIEEVNKNIFEEEDEDNYQQSKPPSSTKIRSRMPNPRFSVLQEMSENEEDEEAENEDEDDYYIESKDAFPEILPRTVASLSKLSSKNSSSNSGRSSRNSAKSSADSQKLGIRGKNGHMLTASRSSVMYSGSMRSDASSYQNNVSHWRNIKEKHEKRSNSRSNSSKSGTSSSYKRSISSGSSPAPNNSNFFENLKKDRVSRFRNTDKLDFKPNNEYQSKNDLNFRTKQHLAKLLKDNIKKNITRDAYDDYDEFDSENSYGDSNSALWEIDSATGLPKLKSGGQNNNNGQNSKSVSSKSFGLQHHRRHHGPLTFYGKNSYDETPIERFRKAAKVIMTLTRVCNCLRHHVMETHGHMVFHQMAANNSAVNANGDSGKLGAGDAANFNLNDFKCHAEFKFPTRGKWICEKDPSQRSEKMIQELRKIMLTMDCFRAYAPHIQSLMCKRLRYSRYERRRLIVRKGHVATSLYFIFSGSVGVAMDVEGTSVFTDPEPIILRKGTVFGEMGLIKNQNRNCSIVCMEPTEFLSIDKDDFIDLDLFEIYKKVENSEIQDRFKYFRANSMFKTCTDEQLNLLSQTCKNQWFLHNQVIVKDTNKTDTVNFVKSGRVAVIRLVQLDSSVAFKQNLVDSGSFPKLNTLGQSLRSTNEENADKTDNIIKRLVVPDLNFSVYMQVDQLQTGQVYGLDHIAYPDSRIFTLISEGCELLRLPIGKVVDMVGPQALKKILLQRCKPHPSDEELSKLFLAMNHWRFYRSKQVDKVVEQSILNRVGRFNEKLLNKRAVRNNEWKANSVKMPWNNHSLDGLKKYLVPVDTKDASGDYYALRNKIYAANPNCFGEENTNGTEAVRRRGKFDALGFEKRLSIKFSAGQLESLKLVSNLETYDPRERAKFLREQVESKERELEMMATGEIRERKREGIDKKMRDIKNQNQVISRLIQGIDFPNFRLSSFS